MRKIWIALALLVFLGLAIYSMTNLFAMPPTYNGAQQDAAALAAEPWNYEVENADGIAAVIVQETLAKTRAQNVVTAVLFDFRGYDTMGEAFILLTAIAGCLVMLRPPRKKEAKRDD